MPIGFSGYEKYQRSSVSALKLYRQQIVDLASVGG